MTPEDRKTLIRLTAYRQAETQWVTSYGYTNPGEEVTEPPTDEEVAAKDPALLKSVEAAIEDAAASISDSPLQARSGPGSPECIAACAAVDVAEAEYAVICDNKAIKATEIAILQMWKTFYCSV